VSHLKRLFWYVTPKVCEGLIYEIGVRRTGVPGRLAPPMKLRLRVRRDLEAIVGSRRSAVGSVERARIVLLAAEGWSNAAIGRELGCADNTVAKWRNRFKERPKLRTLKDAAIRSAVHGADVRSARADQARL
jgi:hypothetical protein